MQRYKIGAVSKMLNIPVETIRYLEKQGLLSPERDADSGYRYYDIWDVNRLLDYKKYRQIGFSSKEAVNIVKGSSLKSLIRQLDRKKQEAEYLSDYYRAKMLKLKNFQIMLSYASEMDGKYLILNRPENYSLFTRYYNGKDVRHRDAQDTGGGYEELTNQYPFVEHIYRIRTDCAQAEKAYDTVQLGFTVKKQWVDRIHIRLLPQMEHLPAVSSIFTILRMGEKQFFSAELLKDTFEYAKRNGYQIQGDITGIYIATVEENGSKVRYVEIWVPIKTAEVPLNGKAAGSSSELEKIFV